MKAIVQEWPAREAGMRGTCGPAREARGRSHPTREMAAADVTTAKSGAPTEAPGMPAEPARVAATKTAVTPTSALRPQGHCEEKGERRDGRQATHTKLL